MSFISRAALLLSTGGFLMGCSVYDSSLVDLTGGSGGEGGGTGGSSGMSGAGGTGATGGSAGTAAGGTGGTAGSGTGGTSGTGNVGGCNPFKVPAPPDADTIVNREVELPPIVNVMRTLDMGDSEPNDLNPPTRFRNIGLDLDGKCTSADDPTEGECRLPTWAQGAIDGETSDGAGIDNAMGAVIQRVRNTVGAFSSENYTARLESGETSVIYKVSKWNGEPNDDQVRVEVFVAAPFAAFERANGCIRENLDGGAPTMDAGADAGACPVPKWDGSDVWPIASDSVFDDDPNKPKFFDDFSYVVNGQLVANLTASNLRLDVYLSSVASVKLDMLLAGASSVCDLEIIDTAAVGQVYATRNCILGGRWNADHLLHQLSQFPDPSQGTSGAPLCSDSPLYPTFKQSICGATDIFDGVATPSSICNSISMGVTFSTYPAHIGAVFGLDPVDPRCEKGVNEPNEDSCATLAN